MQTSTQCRIWGTSLVTSFLCLFSAWKNQWKHLWLQEWYLEFGNGNYGVCYRTFSVHPNWRTSSLAKLLRTFGGHCGKPTTFCSTGSVLPWVLLICIILVMTTMLWLSFTAYEQPMFTSSSYCGWVLSLFSFLLLTETSCLVISFCYAWVSHPQYFLFKLLVFHQLLCNMYPDLKLSQVVPSSNNLRIDINIVFHTKAACQSNSGVGFT